MRRPTARKPPHSPDAALRAPGAVRCEPARPKGGGGKGSADIVLLRQFFSNMSLPVVGETREANIYFLQVLDFERRNIIIRPCGPR